MPKISKRLYCLVLLGVFSCEPERTEKREASASPVPTSTPPSKPVGTQPPAGNGNGATTEKCDETAFHCGAIDDKVLEACKAATPALDCTEGKIPLETYATLAKKAGVAPANTDSGIPAGAKSCTVTSVVNSSLNFRDAPTTQGKKLAALSAGAKVEFISEKNGWVQGKYEGKTGWTCKSGACTEGQGDFLNCSNGTNLNLVDPINEEQAPGRPTNADGTFG